MNVEPQTESEPRGDAWMPPRPPGSATPRTVVHLTGYAIRGGCERCCETFIRHSPELEHRVLVLGLPGPMTAVWRDLGARVDHLDVLELGWLGFYRRVQEAVTADEFDRAILWAGIRTPLLLAAFASAQRPVVLHAGNPLTKSGRVSWLLRACEVFPRPRKATVIACSDHVARSFRHAPYYHRLAVISCLNPVESPDAPRVRPRPLSGDGVVRVGMVARLDPIKDHATLLRAFAGVRADWPQAELHLAGDGPLRKMLRELADALGIGTAVHFHGSVTDVPAFLESLDLFCYLTTVQEGMGIALAEALATGLPSIVSELPVMHEVAGEGADSVVHYVPNDPERVARAIGELLRDVDERRRLSRAAWRRASTVFSPHRVVGAYLAAMEGTA